MNDALVSEFHLERFLSRVIEERMECVFSASSANYDILSVANLH